MISIIYSPLCCNATYLYFRICACSDTSVRKRKTGGGKVNCLIHFPVTVRISNLPTPRTWMHTVISWATDGKENREEVPFFPLLVPKNVNAQIHTRHALHTDGVRKHTPTVTYPSTHTHRGNSCGVGAQIKTNADESSFCEPHQCSASGAVLLQLQWRLLGLVTSCVRFSHRRIPLCHIFTAYIPGVDCWRNGRRCPQDKRRMFF